MWYDGVMYKIINANYLMEELDMKCSFCGANTDKTVRDSYRTLYNCCDKCYREKNKNKESLSISCIFKGKKVEDEDNMYK